jgi:hypothetical protein
MPGDGIVNAKSDLRAMIVMVQGQLRARAGELTAENRKTDQA